MSELNDELLDDNLDYENETDDEPKRDSRQFVRKLEQEAKEGKRAKREADEAKAEAAKAKRDLALIKAGIDIDSPTGKLFVKGYDGEATVDAIKAAAAEYGLLPTSQEPSVKQELDGMDRIASASTASAPAVNPTAMDRLRKAESPDEILKVLREEGIAISQEQPGEWISLV